MLLVITLLCKSTSNLGMFFTVFRNEVKIIMGMWSSKCEKQELFLKGKFTFKAERGKGFTINT